MTSHSTLDWVNPVFSYCIEALAGFGWDTVEVTQHRVYSGIKKRGMLVWIWIMHEKKAEVEMVMLEQIGVSISEERFFFFTLYFILYSGAVCVTEHLQHSVIAGNSKDPSASFNARNLCCPWAINNSWRSVLLEYYNMHVYTSIYVCLDVWLSF